MSGLDKLLSILAPFDCLSCGHEGELLCPICLDELPNLPERCYCCHKPSDNNMTCPDCLQSSSLNKAHAAVIYSGAAKDIVWKLKSDGAISTATLMARRMVEIINLTQDRLIIPIPTASSRVRQRGYNQAELIARQLAGLTGWPLVQALARHGQAHQVGASREQRLGQLSDAFRVRLPDLITGQNILLVDDVLTTGTTLEAAAQVLSRAEADNIEAIAFAQPLLKDKRVANG